MCDAFALQYLLKKISLSWRTNKLKTTYEFCHKLLSNNNTKLMSIDKLK